MLEQFESLTRNPEVVQRDRLLSILGRNAGCSYGQRYGFEQLHSVRDFQRAVPVVTAEELRPETERMARGESCILVSDPVVYYGETSGTTGAPKLVPFTAVYLGVVKQHLKLWAKLFGRIFPGVAAQNVFSMVNRSPIHYTDSGIPCGSLANILSFGEGDDTPNHWLPPGCFAIPDQEARYYLVLLFTLQAPLRCMVAINPSTLVILCNRLNTYADSLICDLRNGTLTNRIELDEESRARMEAQLTPAPDLAGRLAALRDAHGELRPMDVWPDLSGLVCWKGGSVGFFINQFSRWYGQTPVFELGYMATEGMFTLPLSTEGSAGVLAVQNHFFEFVPAAVRDASPDDPAPQTLLAHELEVGESYYMLVTGDNGLYRYDINDVVRVTGMHNATPELEFLHKGRHMLSITGEKMGEAHIAEAIGRAAMDHGFFLQGVSATVRLDSIPRYLIAIEAAEGLPETQAQSFLTTCDQRLREANPEYEFHRRRGALETPVLALLAPGAYAAFTARRVSRGAAEGQIKPPCLFKSEAQLREQLPVIAEIA